jgi:hypothetical protein
MKKENTHDFFPLSYVCNRKKMSGICQDGWGPNPLRHQRKFNINYYPQGDPDPKNILSVTIVSAKLSTS